MHTTGLNQTITSLHGVEVCLHPVINVITPHIPLQA